MVASGLAILVRLEPEVNKVSVVCWMNYHDLQTNHTHERLSTVKQHTTQSNKQEKWDETTEKSDQQSNDKQGTAYSERAVGSRAKGKTEQETTRRRNEKRCQEKKSGKAARQGRQDIKTRKPDEPTHNEPAHKTTRQDNENTTR